jgi:hypothetical protein
VILPFEFSHQFDGLMLLVDLPCLIFWLAPFRRPRDIVLNLSALASDHSLKVAHLLQDVSSE